ncbi:MAG: flagellar hook-length control protein FliK [Brevibacillus sp.]|nr:flagellar hook-length control protein FliK [Brevibacillus sp.]
MNVANTLMIGGAPDPTAAADRQQLEGTAASIGNLFALQLGNVMQAMQSTTLSADNAAEQLSDSELTPDAMLAMLEQFLAMGLLTTEQYEQLTASVQTGSADNAQSAETMMLLSNADGRANRQLVATFMKQGLAEDQAVQLANILVDAARSGKDANHPAVRQNAEQAANWLGKLLTAKEPDQPEAIVQRTATRPVLLKQADSSKSLAHLHLNREEAAVPNSTMQPLRLHQAIATYQAETGAYSRSQRSNLQQSLLSASQVQPLAEDQGGLAAVPVGQAAQPVHSTLFIQPQNGAQAAYPVRSEQFVQQVSNLFLTRLKVTEGDGFSEAKLVLHPRSLGQVDVKITSQNGVITAYFTADTASGRELLDNQLSQLRTALIQQGLQVDRLEVTHQSSQQHVLDFHQQKEQGRQQQTPNQQQSQEPSAEEQAEFSFDALIDETASLAALWNRARLAGSRGYSVYA